MCKDCFYTRTQEPYEFLLQRREWKAKREIILSRDLHRCTFCGRKESDEVCLHVHHKHYIKGLDPWEYKDSELITLCEECHSMVHLTQEIPIFILEDGILKQVSMTPCSRCGGTGYLPQYNHVMGGICFRCHGARYDEFIEAYEIYAKEHDIDMSNLNDGFVPISEETRNMLREVCVMQSQFDKNKLYLKVVLDDNKYTSAHLDFSVDAKPGDKLSIPSIRYKEYRLRGSGKDCLVLTGKVLTDVQPQAV